MRGSHSGRSAVGMRSAVALVFISAWSLGAAAAASERGTDDMRPAGEPIEIAASTSDAALCIGRALGRNGSITPYDVAGGKALDWYLKGGLFALPGNNILTVFVIDGGATRTLSIRYRHPFSEKSAANMLADLAKKCGTPATP